MKKYIMNKNVIHDGQMYSKNSEIKNSDKGFKELVHSGHANEIEIESEPEKKQELKEKKK